MQLLLHTTRPVLVLLVSVSKISKRGGFGKMGYTCVKTPTYLGKQVVSQPRYIAHT